MFNSRLSGLLILAVVLAGCGGGTTTRPPADPPTEDVPPEFECTFEDQTLPSLEVAAGETCELTLTTVTGAVTLAPGATLYAYIGTTLGSVQGQGAAEVILDGVVVEGDVQLEGGKIIDLIGASDVGGNLQLVGNSGAINMSETSVEGNVQVSQNTGGVSIEETFVEGNLLCEGNDPAPEGIDNTVSGSREGQCSTL